MAFDLELIERALDQAVCDAEDLLAERRRNYAGYPDVGKFALYEDAVRDAKSARAEFARMRKALEGGRYARASRTGTVRTPVGWCVPKMDYLLVEDAPALPVGGK